MRTDAAMKIHVNRIPADGYREDVAYGAAALDVERTDLQFEQPIAVSSFITKAENEVVVQARIRGVATLCCARCLESFEASVEADAMFAYHTAPADVIDITDDVRQELILASPMIPLCRAECKGLCPACGQNWNAAGCSHQQPRE